MGVHASQLRRSGLRPGVLADFIILAVVHAALCVFVRKHGFDHVSDDDFARVTIAQAFAHKPRLDPSGTSWLPFPFWVHGGLMLVTGRSLLMARSVSIALASVAATAPYVAMRQAGASRAGALTGVAFAILSPWSIWLGATTVPESTTASLAAAGVIGLGMKDGGNARAAWWWAICLLAACLSRYEPWPMAAVVAVVMAARAVRKDGHGPRRVGLLLLVVLGPAFWMLWNAHAHGSAVHFFHRVSNFKRAIGEGASDPRAALAMFPRLLFAARPDVLVATLGALVFLFRKRIRDRWLFALLAVIAQIAFLAYGNMRDGAPAHHPERALLGAYFVLAMFAGDVLVDSAALGFAAWRPSIAPILGVAGVVGALFTANLPKFRTPPGTAPTEQRSAQIAAGKALRREDPIGIVVTPCQYEHFALIAELSKPERVDIRPKTDELVVKECPRVERR
ncbi:MAG: hypothetical protein JST00_27610 [Deltaproteobacteria bacterium]|nr:hypothetical protein [Deltaproteobacteria bacterium]